MRTVVAALLIADAGKVRIRQDIRYVNSLAFEKYSSSNRFTTW